MAKWCRNLLLGFVIGLLSFSLIGCGSTSKSTSGGGGGTSYSGNSSITGAVVASQADINQVQSNSISASSLSFSSSIKREKVFNSFSPKTIKALSSSSSANVIDGATATLYVITSTGEQMLASGVPPVNVTDGTYTFPGVRDGVSYLVKVEKVGTDSTGKQNILRITAPAFIPEGEGQSTTVNVSPLTKVAMDIIYEIVRTARNAGITQEVIDNILVSVENAIYNMNEQLPLLAEEYDSVDNNEIFDTDSTFLEKVKNDDSVLAAKTEALTAAKLDKGAQGMSDQEIKNFFADIFGGEAPPDSFLEAFKDAYKAGKTNTIKDMTDGLYESLVPSAQIPVSTEPNSQNVKTLYLNNTLSIINNDFLTPLYNFYDGNTTNVAAFFSDMDEEDLHEISLFKAIFPKDDRLTLPLTGATELNVPQGLMLFHIIMPMDDMDELSPTDNSLVKTWSDYSFNPDFGSDSGDDDGGDMPFDPLKYMADLGWIAFDAQKVYIMDFRLDARQESFLDGFFAGTANYQDNSYSYVQEHVLEVEVGVVIPRGYDASGGKAVTKAIITYRDGSGHIKSVDLIPDAEHSSDYEKEFSIEPWKIKSEWQSNGSTANISKLIRDFGEGDATVKVLDANGVVLASQTVKIMKPSVGKVSFIYPKGPDMDMVEKQGWDHSFIPDELDVVEKLIDGVSQNVANPRFQWEPPVGSNSIDATKYTLGYIVELRKTIRKLYHDAYWNPPTGYQYWASGSNSPMQITESNANDLVNVNGNSERLSWGSKEIWSSWEKRRFIYSTEFQAPNDLVATTKSSTRNFEERYEFQVRPVLVDIETNRKVWEGKQTRTEFYIGVKKWTISLRGEIAFPPLDVLKRIIPDKDGEEPIAGQWKVALFHTHGQDPEVAWNHKDYFWSPDVLGNRVPVSGIFNLGSNSDVSNIDSVRKVAYQLPPIKRADNIIANNQQYQLILWYEYDVDALLGHTSVIGEIDYRNDGEGQQFQEYINNFEMNIGLNQGYLHYWKRDVNGSEENGGLLDPAKQRFDYDFAQRTKGADDNFDESYKDDLGQNDWVDNQDNAHFWKDPGLGRAVLEGFWNGSGFGELPVTFSEMTVVALVRSWDQSIVASVSATEVLSLSNVSNRLVVSMNVFGLSPSQYDDYRLWIYNLEGTPVVYTNPVMVDDWFVRVDPPQVYQPKFEFSRVPSADALWFTIEGNLSLSHVVVECASSPNHQVLFDLSNYDSVTMNANNYTYKMYDYNNPVWINGQYGTGSYDGMLQLLMDLGTGSTVYGFTVTPDANVDPVVVGSFVGN